MKPAEAQYVLKGPLRFGDPDQIQALAIVEKIESAVRAILKCEHVKRPFRHAPRCSCLRDFQSDIVSAALKDPRISTDLAWSIRNRL
jgi:hypothetical protein